MNVPGRKITRRCRKSCSGFRFQNLLALPAKKNEHTHTQENRKQGTSSTPKNDRCSSQHALRMQLETDHNIINKNNNTKKARFLFLAGGISVHTAVIASLPQGQRRNRKRQESKRVSRKQNKQQNEAEELLTLRNKMSRDKCPGEEEGKPASCLDPARKIRTKQIGPAHAKNPPPSLLTVPLTRRRSKSSTCSGGQTLKCREIEGDYLVRRNACSALA